MGYTKVTAADNKPGKSNRFIHQLLNDVKLLEQMIADGKFDDDCIRIGAEQELNFIDHRFNPFPIGQAVLDLANDPHFTHEYARFNAEINLDPLKLESGALNTLEKDLTDHMAKINDVAKELNGEVLLAGILPSVRKKDLARENLTPLKRYDALDALLNKIRGGSFDFRIEGKDLLVETHNSSLFEACNTSFQIHLQVPIDEVIAQYNWAQAIAGPVLSACTNSPLLFGKRLWRETRIALFQQSVDIRSVDKQSHNREPRVSFGTEWVKESILEVYREDIARHRILLMIDSKAPISEEIPKLKALNVHNGTVYRWNRPCYGVTEGKPHLRIENRYIPAGPTIIDQIANCALWIGLMKGMPEEAHSLPELMDFGDAKSNFLKAARMGLGAQFCWLDKKRVPSKNLMLEKLLPLAYKGLSKAGISKKEATKYLSIIEERVKTEKTGSQWVVDSFTQMKKTKNDYAAAIATTAGILNRQKQNLPVHKWAPLNEDEVSTTSYETVDQIMAKDLFTVESNDSLEYTCTIMSWRKIHHMPVINSEGELEGLVTAGMLLHQVSEKNLGKKLVHSIMLKDPITIEPGTTLLQALQIMNENSIGSLPIVNENKHLVGFITTKDMVKVMHHMIKGQES